MDIKMATMRKYYAVAVGRQVGIVETWNECRAMVQDYPGARFRSFSAYNQAEAYLQSQQYLACYPVKRTRDPVESTPIQQRYACNGQLTYIYTDRACQIRRCGTGFTLKDASNHVIYRYESLEDFTTTNETEYLALIAGLRECQRRNLLSVVALLDSKLVVEQTNGRWKARETRMKELQEDVAALRSAFRYLRIEHVDQSSVAASAAPQKRTHWNITYF
jgi:ribonuclease HI